MERLTIRVNEPIVLQQIEIADAGVVFQAIDSQRDYLGKWLPFVAFTREITDTMNFIHSIYSVPVESQELVFVIRYNNEFAGLIGFRGTDRVNGKTEIGYWLSEKYQKKGIVTQAVKALVDYAFNTMGFNRIQIKCAIGNLPSQRIPRRLGFFFEGIEREGELLSNGAFTDVEVYSILKRETMSSS